MDMTKRDAIAYVTGRGGVDTDQCYASRVLETPLLLEATQGPATNGEVRKVLMGRLAKLEEVAAAMVFSSSETASFLTGLGLVVHQGYTAS